MPSTLSICAVTSRSLGSAASAEAVSVTPDLLAEIEPADHQALHGGHALLDHLLRLSAIEIDEQGSNRRNRDQPVEPVSGRRRACRTPAGIADCPSRGTCRPRGLVPRGCCRARGTAEGIEQTCPAKQVAEARRQCRGNIVLLAREEIGDAACIERPALLSLLPDGAQHNRSQHSEQRAGGALIYSCKLRNRLAERILVVAAQQHREHL